MHSTLILSFAALALAQSTSLAPAVSTSGQVQSSAVNNPSTFLTQTNSLGVVTGQPMAVTTQPLAVTTQPTVVTSQTQAATFVPGQPGIPQGLNTTLATAVPTVAAAGNSTAAGSAARNGTTVVTATTNTPSGPTSSSRASSTSSGSSSSSSSGSSSGAVATRVGQTGLGMVVAGALFALFL